MMIVRRCFLLVSFCFSFLSSEIAVRETASGIVVENSAVRKVIECSSLTASPIYLKSIFLKQRKQELLLPNSHALWFEFCINQKLVSNAVPLWKYDGHSIDSLTNGGMEIRLRFVSSGGLRLALAMQMFPGAAIWRERAELWAESEQSILTLNKYKNRVHIVFPSCTVPVSGSESVSVQDIQMAVWNGGCKLNPNDQISYDERREEAGWRIGRNLGQNYMYHPLKTMSAVKQGDSVAHRGQVLFTRIAGRKSGWMVLHEHDAPPQRMNDEAVVIEHTRTSKAITLAVRTRAGAYAEGERLSSNTRFVSTWVTSGWYEGSSFDDGESFLWSYLDRWMCENPNTRMPRFYYNTWGMQRDESAKKKDVRGVLTQARVIEDIRLASELNIELYVLDDGWQEHFGDWTAHPQRFPNGLKPLSDEISLRETTFGIWLGCLATDSSAKVAAEHPDWLVRDSTGNPIKGRWERKTFCLVSDYQNYFVQACKRLMDEGVRYFKWDGLDYHPCSSALHHHGDSTWSEQERIERHRYEMIRSIVDAARDLRLYNKDVVVEIDATEANRPIGFAFLHEGKFFWINNGASWYGDRSQYRAKSMRTVASFYARLLPTGLQTYANYPHNHPTFGAQRYNINSSLIGGRGFWGDLSDMTAAERQSVGVSVRLAKRITLQVAGIRPEVIGQVGSAPEIYSAVDRARAVGQVVAFSGTKQSFPYEITKLNTDSLLAVVQQAFSVSKSTVLIPFEFPLPDVSREAFLFDNQGSGINIISSTSWLRDARILEPGVMHFLTGAAGQHIIRWRSDNGVPTVSSSEPSTFTIQEIPEKGEYRIKVNTPAPDIIVKVRVKK